MGWYGFSEADPLSDEWEPPHDLKWIPLQPDLSSMNPGRLDRLYKLWVNRRRAQLGTAPSPEPESEQRFPKSGGYRLTIIWIDPVLMSPLDNERDVQRTDITYLYLMFYPW
jgi:hypothetical protein